MREISFFNEDIEFPSFYSDIKISTWLDRIAAVYSKKLGALSFIFCNDDYILAINRQYLNHDYYTDVITFDYTEGNLLSGDIFISLETVRSNSELYQTDFEEEFHRVICHSMLHLIGFKDKTPKEEDLMRKNENECLNILKTI